MKAIILVGGQGTRMRPLTDHLPKNIVPLCGTPFLTYQIEYLKKANIREIVFSIGYRPKDIRSVYGDGRRLGVKIHYALEKEQLGTAGAIKNSEKFVKGHPVVVLNGDILTDIPLKKMMAFHYQKKNIATLGLFRVEDPTAYGLVLLDKNSRVVRFLEKPKPEEVVTDTINAGVYIFEPKVLDMIPSGIPYSAERALFPGILETKAFLGGFVWSGYWQDIGTPRKYLTTHWDVLDGVFPVWGRYRKRDRRVYLGSGIKIAKSAVVKGPVLIGDGCVIGENVKILPYTVLGKKCVVGQGSVLSKSLLWDGVKIGELAQLQEVILGRRSQIQSRRVVPANTVLGDRSKF